MSNEDLIAGIIAWIVMILGFLFLIYIGYLLVLIPGRISCKYQWSGYNPSYSIMGGCKIPYHGKMTSTDNIRFLDKN